MFIQEGMGALKIEDDGIRVEGTSQFDQAVKFSQLSAPDVSSHLKHLIHFYFKGPGAFY
jgi:hypothetical protein